MKMAQLPPKVPTITPYLHKATAMATFFSPAPPAAAWVDEFLDFSAARRAGAHRRSASDGITFLEASEADDDFDRLDDDQLLSMFCDQVAPLPPAEEEALSSAGNASSPSDSNSVSEEKVFVERRMQGECEEAQSQCGGGAPAGAAEVDSQSPPAAAAPATEQVMDTKRVKRILANRQSAQRSRVRKLQYISELERSVTALQTEVSALSPRVAFFDHQRSLLSAGNSHLKQRIAALAQDRIFMDAHQEALRKEIERLSEVYRTQNNKNTAGSSLERDDGATSKETVAGASH